jgi:hypothetical protein
MVVCFQSNLEYQRNENYFTFKDKKPQKGLFFVEKHKKTLKMRVFLCFF